jgi:hypothetical protein
MFEPFDIFQVGDDGQPLWIESALTLEHAHTQVGQLAASQPGQYLVFNHRTGHEILVSVIERRLSA